MNSKIVYIQPYYSWVVKIKTNILMDKEEKWGERDGREERELICLYYFNELYVKIETEM